jgi:hypothetical protein
MKTKFRLCGGLVSLALLTINSQLSTAFAQGTLTPPGAPAPTMLTLSQVQPRIPVDTNHTPSQNVNEAFTISVPGSYYLTTNLTSTKSSVVHITSANVTVDLSGYTIAGNGSGNGILIDSGASCCTVRNGSVTNCSTGINDSGSHGSSYLNLAVSACSYEGLVSGLNNLIEGCQVENCTCFIALHAVNGSIVRHCAVAYNIGDYGIAAEANSTVIECSVYTNTYTGTSDGTAAAIWTGPGCNVIGCVLGNNTGVGGIFANAGCTINNCTVTGQSSEVASSAGIYAYAYSTVTGCTVTGTSSTTNSPHGFLLGTAVTMANCTAAGNKGDGFQYGANCLITGCAAHSNSGNGFHGTSTGNRLDGNFATGNSGTGILSSSASADYIVRNSSTGNTTANYSPTSGANIGPITTASTTGASPWANLQ